MWMRTQMLLTFHFCNRLNILPKTAPSYSIFEGLETVGVTIHNNHTENLEICRWHESFHNPFSSSLQLKQTAQSESARFGAVIKRSQDREENLKHFVYRSWLMGEVGTSVVVLKEKCKMVKWCQMTSFIHWVEHHLSRNLDKTALAPPSSRRQFNCNMPFNITRRIKLHKQV